MPIPKDLLQKKWTLPKGGVMAGYVYITKNLNITCETKWG